MSESNRSAYNIHENEISKHIEKPSSGLSIAMRIAVIVIAATFIISFAFALRSAHKHYDLISRYGKYDSVPYEDFDISILNSADKESLMEVNGIGDKRAELIIAFRDAMGGFTDPRQIMYLDGIGEKLFLRIIEHFYSGYSYRNGSIVRIE